LELGHGSFRVLAKDAVGIFDLVARFLKSLLQNEHIVPMSALAQSRRSECCSGCKGEKDAGTDEKSGQAFHKRSSFRGISLSVLNVFKSLSKQFQYVVVVNRIEHFFAVSAELYETRGAEYAQLM
jgi:hypothetical protein